MTALERAQESKRHQDIKVENLPEATRKWFRRIYRLEPHTSLSWRRTNLIKDIFGSLTVDAILFIYNAGMMRGVKRGKGCSMTDKEKYVRQIVEIISKLDENALRKIYITAKTHFEILQEKKGGEA